MPFPTLETLLDRFSLVPNTTSKLITVNLSESQEEKLNHLHREVEDMSQQVGGPGPRRGSRPVGLGASIWAFPSDQNSRSIHSFRFGQSKYSFAFQQLKYHYNKSRISPLLHTPMATLTFRPTFESQIPSRKSHKTKFKLLMQNRHTFLPT